MGAAVLNSLCLLVCSQWVMSLSFFWITYINSRTESRVLSLCELLYATASLHVSILSRGKWTFMSPLSALQKLQAFMRALCTCSLKKHLYVKAWRSEDHEIQSYVVPFVVGKLFAGSRKTQMTGQLRTSSNAQTHFQPRTRKMVLFASDPVPYCIWSYLMLPHCSVEETGSFGKKPMGYQSLVVTFNTRSCRSRNGTA